MKTSINLNKFRFTDLRLRLLPIMAMASALVGCVTVPADHDVLPQRDLAQAQLAADIKLTQADWPQSHWWTVYGDAQLNRLVEQALSESPTLQSAAARIEAARVSLQRERSETGGGVSLNANSARTLYSADGFFPPPIGGAWFTETTVTVAARYDFDWWGKHRAAIDAALGEINARQAEYAQVQQTLAAAVAQSYFALQGTWAHQANLREMEAVQNALVQDKVKRIAHGLASAEAERSAEAELATLKQQTAMLDAQAAREREALRALLGADAQALADLKPQALPRTPAALPATLGPELLARRPDLQAARWRVEASLDHIDSAKAAFYPDINLSGFIGTDVISLDQLFRYGSRTLSFGPSLSLPLFDSGHLKAGLASARAERNEMIADYNQSICNAVRDVAQAAIGIRGLQGQLAEQQTGVQATEAILRGAQARFERGLADNSMLLAARQAVNRQHDASLQLQSQLLQADVTLIKTLGGGYRASSDSAAEHPLAAAQ